MPTILRSSLRSNKNQPTTRADLIDEVKELADVVGDGGDVGVGPLQVLLVYLAHALHALIHLYATILEGQRREVVDDLHFSQRYFFFPNF